MPTRLPFDHCSCPCAKSARGLPHRSSPAIRAPCCSCRSTPTAADWAALPHGAVLRALYARKVRKAGDCFHLRVGARARDPADRRLPGRRGQHLRAPASRRQTRAQRAGRRAAIAAAMAAGLRRGCRRRDACTPPSPRSKRRRFASRRFKSKPKAARASRASTSRGAESLHDLDLTLATAAGNNLARWLTALPPNTLDAAAYRRLLQAIRAAS